MKRSSIISAVLAFSLGMDGNGLAQGVIFEDVTRSAGIRFRHDNGGSGSELMPESMGSGCAFWDFDGDGDADILLISCATSQEHGSEQPSTMALYRNDGDGRFSDVTARAGLKQPMFGMGCAIGDYDNDGDSDLYVACLGANRLFRNRGDGRFEDVTAQVGVGDSTWSVCAVWLDYDRDGDLDLFVGNYLQWSAERDTRLSARSGARSYAPQLYDPEYSRLYRNDGDRFTDVSEASGIGGKPGKGMSAVSLDYNDDGWPDILMSNDTMPDFLFRNNGDGTFTEDGLLAGVAYSAAGVAKSGMGVDAGDVRNAGREDVAIGNFAYEMISLFQNQDGAYFTDRTLPSGVGHPSAPFVTFGVFFFDFDLDGRLDLFAANGHVDSRIHRVKSHLSYAQRPLLFRNRGDGGFEEVGATSGLADRIVGRGAAYADYDGDGDLDVLVATNNGRPALFRNEGGNRNRCLRVKLVGNGAQAGLGTGQGREEPAGSNRDGVGATVRVRSGTVVQSRTVRAGSSYCSQSELILTFGLGRAGIVDAMEVAWPSGRLERINNVAAGQTVTVREGRGIVAGTPLGSNPAAD
ncbi:MAG: CRTAC1 family protein [Candidatus Latescibacteria bacterium]|nr:CRTAC1 family protein [Candidatus Latescibacterota bacterium]